MPDSQGVGTAAVGAAAEASDHAGAAYGLVARLMLREVDEAALAMLRHPDVCDVLETLAPGCGDYLCRSWGPAEIEEAAADYCALFVLTGGASPRASAWLGGDAVGLGATLGEWTEQALAALGLAVDADVCGRLPADHLGVSLLLLEACEREATPLARRLAAELLTLLRAWIPAWAAAVAGATANPLYRATAELIVQSVAEARPNPA